MGTTASATIDLNQVLRRRLTITGSTLRARSVEEKGASLRRCAMRCGRSSKSGRVKPVVYRTFRSAEAAAAHRLMESSEHIGKIVLTSR